MARTIDLSDLLDVRDVARILGVSRSRVLQLDPVLYPLTMPYGERGKVRRLYDRGVVDRAIAARTRHAEQIDAANRELAESTGGVK